MVRQEGVKKKSVLGRLFFFAFLNRLLVFSGFGVWFIGWGFFYLEGVSGKVYKQNRFQVFISREIFLRRLYSHFKALPVNTMIYFTL